ncbi:hypothetical protein NSS98_21255 [Paenibacillus sp. FSL E2-0274]|uniref:hypothetical protein n=1 Tax=Paenibacillus TaxID=44249 RepID=UPI00096CFF90|nr:hypothetical protein [Paenibacillus odorifer]OME31780.1 hypothetical protein BSK63_14610 [Paenibacillus odorifer]OME37900.1 hypothetical protein BSK46_14325 [Paenibacillus odorifer]
MDCVKVTKYMKDLDVIGETSAETYDALLIGSSIAITVDNCCDKTYVMVERVEDIDGDLRVGDRKEDHLYDIDLNGTYTVEDLASMSAVDYILACIQ